MTNTAIHDLVIHIQQTLDSHQFNQLAETIQQSEGVVSIGRDEQRPRFISVGYTPAHITSIEILNSIADSGLRACVVGRLCERSVCQ